MNRSRWNEIVADQDSPRVVEHHNKRNVEIIETFCFHSLLKVDTWSDCWAVSLLLFNPFSVSIFGIFVNFLWLYVNYVQLKAINSCVDFITTSVMRNNFLEHVSEVENCIMIKRHT
jgi:hypothetical protein